MNIRKYNDSDKKQVIKLYNLCFEHECDDFNMNSSGEIIVIETDDNNIIGMATIDIMTDVFRNVKYAYLNNICIHPDCQKKGLGSLLIKEIENYSKDNGCAYLMLTSNKNRISAHKLYLKNKFEIIDTCVFKKYLN